MIGLTIESLRRPLAGRPASTEHYRTMNCSKLHKCILDQFTHPGLNTVFALHFDIVFNVWSIGARPNIAQPLLWCSKQEDFQLKESVDKVSLEADRDGPRSAEKER